MPQHPTFKAGVINSPATQCHQLEAPLPGAPTGREYVIGVEAQKQNDDLGLRGFDTATYDFTVYTVPVTDTKRGHWTAAIMSGSVHVGWNGTTAETIVSGNIRDEMGMTILYGINIGYKVIRLTPLGFEAAELDRIHPPRLKIGFIQVNSKKHPPSASDSYTKSYTLPNGGFEGQRYRVEARVEITASHVGGGRNEQDALPVIDSVDITIPDID